MGDVGGDLPAIRRLVSANDPFSRLPDTVYLDAQAVVQWVRLGIIDKVLDEVPPDSNGYARFTLLGVSYKEAVDVLVHRTKFSRHELEEYLADRENLFVDPVPHGSETQIGQRALQLQAQMFLEEGELSPPPGSLRHMGEAEAFAHIERLEDNSLFLTGDKGAIQVARRTRIVKVARPLAFAALPLQGNAGLADLWESFCRSRGCIEKDAAVEECLEHLTCEWITSGAAERGELNGRVTTGDHILSWVRNDVESLDALLSTF